MILERLMVFATVAKHRNVSRASEELRISQPAVSKQLRLLEEDYSTKLFMRRRWGVQLTDTGKIFLREVKHLLKRHEKLQAKFHGVPAGPFVQSLSVGGSFSPSASLLPSLLTVFEKHHPNVELNLRTGDRLEVERMVVKGEVELALINNPPVNFNSQLTMEPFRPEPMVAFVRRHHPLAQKRRINLEELRRFGFVVRKNLGGTRTTEEWLETLSTSGVHPKVFLRCDTPEGVKEAVRNQQGVGLLYREVLQRNINRGEFKTIQLPGLPLKRDSFIVYHKTRPLSPIALEFLALLTQVRHAKRV